MNVTQEVINKEEKELDTHKANTELKNVVDTQPILIHDRHMVNYSGDLSNLNMSGDKSFGFKKSLRQLLNDSKV